MAYETGTATTPGNLLVKLFDFAAANGWTIDDDIADDTKASQQGSIHKNNVYLMFYFDTVRIQMYPARGFTNASTAPGAHPESGSDRSTGYNHGLYVYFDTGPYDSYHFFEDDNYIHIVVNTDGLVYRHFGFGESIKSSNWLGGEYYYGHPWFADGSGYAASPSSDRNSGPFNHTVRGYEGMLVYGKQVGGAALPGAQEAGSKWGFVDSDANQTLYLDPDGDSYNRFYNLSSAKGGITGRILGTGASTFNGYVPLVPLQYGLYDTIPAPANVYFLGTYPDVRACNISALAPEAEHVIGDDTWVVFPMTRKVYVDNTTQWSGGYGLAYKKIIT